MYNDKTVNFIYNSISTDNSAFNIAFFTLFGISCLSSSFMIFVVTERVSTAKLIQFVSGVSPVMYWGTTYVAYVIYVH